MSKTYKIVSALVIIAVVAAGGYYLYQQHRVRKAGVLTENIAHVGDAWTADFTARIGAPEPKVFDTIKDVEHAKSDQVKSVQVISQTDTTKTVEMQIAAAPAAARTSPLVSPSNIFPTSGASPITRSMERILSPLRSMTSRTRAPAR